MEEKRALKDGLGIASFVTGIIGFLTGFIFIGIFLDIVAIILGVIAILSKKSKKGLAIAGVVVGGLGLLTMIFLISIMTDPDEVETSKSKSVQTSITEKTNKSADSPLDESTALTESKLTLCSTIELKNFTVVFNNYEIIKVDNQFADIEEAVVVSTTITNTSNETQTMLTGISKTCFTPNGTEAGDSSQIYMNDEYPSYWHDDLRAKAVLETFLVFDYSADGEYIVEIGSLFGKPKEVFLDIKK